MITYRWYGGGKDVDVKAGKKQDEHESKTDQEEFIAAGVLNVAFCSSRECVALGCVSQIGLDSHKLGGSCIFGRIHRQD